MVADYTLFPYAKVEEMLENIDSMIKWIVDHHKVLGINIKHIVIMGHSAGAHLGTMALLHAIRDEFCFVLFFVFCFLIFDLALLNCEFAKSKIRKKHFCCEKTQNTHAHKIVNGGYLTYYCLLVFQVFIVLTITICMNHFEVLKVFQVWVVVWVVKVIGIIIHRPKLFKIGEKH